MTEPRRYLAHGYLVESDVDLPLPPHPDGVAARGPADPLSGAAGDRSGSPRLRLRSGSRVAVPGSDPPGRVLARLVDDERRTYYTFAADGGTTRLRFHGAVELVADDGLSEVRADVDPAADPGLVPVLGAGALLAVRLLLDGRLVLHASAVARDGRAVAFCGSAGMGKSTLAALAVLSGWRLLTDDVLRVDLAPPGGTGTGTTDGTGGPMVWPGSSALRLRPAAQQVADAFDPDDVHATADGRRAVGGSGDGSAGPAGPLPLAAVVVPRVVRGLSAPQVERLEPFAALRLLLRFPRVAGWTDPGTTAQQLDLLGALCRRLPVVVASVPWGPPFAAADVAATLEQVLQAVDRPAGP
ncbi:hypothetical protein [Jannaschia sp. R86511]|uniref:hypothetical protein n=1 Tax=Jannaschia sp. R86511 TaxID=3093853 RepID=UPI0036D25CAF